MSVNLSSFAWQKVREHVLRRDGYRCQLKLEGCTVDAPLRGGHAHHTIGRHTGLDPAFIVAACRSCNLRVGKPDRHDPAPTRRTEW